MAAADGGVPSTSRLEYQSNVSSRRASPRSLDPIMDEVPHTQIEIDPSEAAVSRSGTMDALADDFNHHGDVPAPSAGMEPETIPIYDVRLLSQRKRSRYNTSRSLPISLAVTPMSELDTASALSSQWVIITDPRRPASTSLSYLSSRRSSQTLNSATHFEEAFSKAGGFHNYQLRVLLMLCLTSLYCGPPMFIWHFLKPVPRHRCRVMSDEPTPNQTQRGDAFTYPELDRYIPKANFWSQEVSSCKKFDREFVMDVSSSATLLSCDQYVFDTASSTYMVTPAVEYEMICDKGWMWNVAPAVFTIGMLAGAILLGLVADRFGRRCALLAALTVMTLGGILEIVVPSPKSYLAVMSLTAVGTMGTFQTAFLLAMELVGSSQRRPVGFTYYMFFHCGYFIATLYAYYIRDWRMQKVALLVPGVIFIIYWWILPESAQWLLTKGRTKEAEDMLSKAAQVNKGHDAGSIVFESKNNNDVLMVQREAKAKREERRANCSELFASAQPRNSFIVIFVIMLLVGAGPVASRLYFQLYDNVYWEYLLNGGLEIAGCIVGILFSPFFTRRQLFLVCSLVVSCAFLLMAILTIYDEWELFWIRIILWKVFISTAVCNLRVLAAELFPTRARGTCLGLCTLLVGVGEFINIGVTPIIERKKGTRFTPKDKEPFVFYGFMAAAAGLLILLLPEMYNKPMPNTFEDCKEFNSYDSDFGGLIKMMQKIQGAKQNVRLQEILEEKRRESQAANRGRRGTRKSQVRRPRREGTLGSRESSLRSTNSSLGDVRTGSGNETKRNRPNSREGSREGSRERKQQRAVSQDQGLPPERPASKTPDEVHYGYGGSQRTSIDTELDLMGFYAYGEKLLASHFSLPTAEAAMSDPKFIPRSGGGGFLPTPDEPHPPPTPTASTPPPLQTPTGDDGSRYFGGAKRKQRDLASKLAESKLSSKRKRQDSESMDDTMSIKEMRDQQTQAVENISLASLNENDL